MTSLVSALLSIGASDIALTSSGWWRGVNGHFRWRGKRWALTSYDLTRDPITPAIEELIFSGLPLLVYYDSATPGSPLHLDLCSHLLAAGVEIPRRWFIPSTPSRRRYPRRRR